MDVTLLRDLVNKYEEEWRGLKLLERFLEEISVSNIEAMALLRNIVELRNKMHPYHSPSSEVVDLMRKLGLVFPVSASIDWKQNCDILLRKFYTALGSLRSTLTTVALKNQTLKT
jgi:hypothetical protein